MTWTVDLDRTLIERFWSLSFSTHCSLTKSHNIPLCLMHFLCMHACFSHLSAAILLCSFVPFSSPPSIGLSLSIFAPLHSSFSSVYFVHTVCHFFGWREEKLSTCFYIRRKPLSVSFRVFIGCGGQDLALWRALRISVFILHMSPFSRTILTQYSSCFCIGPHTELSL